MLDKPIIIIGGGLWGSLLALRLKATMPEVNFKLYEATDKLGEGNSLSFHQSDIEEDSMRWLRPFISHQWNKFRVNFPRYQKWVEDNYCAIESESFNQQLKKLLPQDQVILSTEISLEDALAEGSFVIDTRNNGYFKAQGFQKTFALKVRVYGIHGLKAPVCIDANIDQKGGFRYMQILPLDETHVLVKDVRYSTNPQIYHENFEADILAYLKEKKWGVAEVLDQEMEFRKIPLQEFGAQNEGRVIRLEGILHDTTGESLPDAVRLISRMVKTSFRLGELKEVLKNYQTERRSKRKMLRLINKVLYQAPTPCHERYYFFQYLYQLPEPLRKKFYAGEIEAGDIFRAFITSPTRSALKGLADLLPTPIKN